MTRKKKKLCPVCGKREEQFVKGKCKSCYDKVLIAEFKLKRPERIWARQTITDHRRMGFTYTEGDDIFADQLEAKALMIRECEICGRDLDYKRGKGVVKVNSPHLDRKYNEDFINIGNIMILCQTCSVFKSDRKLEDFERFLGEQVARHKKKYVILAELEMRLKDRMNLRDEND